VIADQAEILSEQERKNLIQQMIKTINVNLDAKLNKHRLAVRFSEEIRTLFEKTATKMRSSVNNTESSSGDSGTLCEVRDGLHWGDSGKSLGAAGSTLLPRATIR
jgi:hypothetical protein